MVEYDVEDEAEERELDGNIEKLFEDDGRKLKEVNEQNNVDSEEEAGDIASKPKLGESSNYLQQKQKNIEELKEKIAEIKAQYPATKGQEPKKGSKKSVSKSTLPCPTYFRWTPGTIYFGGSPAKLLSIIHMKFT